MVYEFHTETSRLCSETSTKLYVHTFMNSASGYSCIAQCKAIERSAIMSQRLSLSNLAYYREESLEKILNPEDDLSISFLDYLVHLILTSLIFYYGESRLQTRKGKHDSLQRKNPLKFVSKLPLSRTVLRGVKLPVLYNLQRCLRLP